MTTVDLDLTINGFSVADLEGVLGFALGPEQFAIICAPLEPTLVVAGAGTGKTTSMAARVAWLVATQQVRPEQVLGLTFTNKAAGELGERINALVNKAASALEAKGLSSAQVAESDSAAEGSEGEEVGDVATVSTYNAFAKAILAEHGLRIGVDPKARLISDGHRHQLAAEVIARTKVDLLVMSVELVELTKAVLALDAALSDRMVTVEQLANFDADLLATLVVDSKQQNTVKDMTLACRERQAVLQLVVEYRETKAARDFTEFNDQMRQATELAINFPEVHAALRDTYRVVMLDEYQDTSVTQARLLAALFGDGHPVTAVGDPCQAIYGWRGAHVDNLDSFPRQFPLTDGEPARTLALTSNWRSGLAILETANAVSKDLRKVHPDSNPLHQPAASLRGTGWVEVGLFETIDDEIAWLVDRIAGIPAADRSSRVNADNFGGVAVLTRSNAHALRAFDALRANGIPASLVGAGPLLERSEVVEVLSVLRLLVDPTANSAMVRLLTGPRWRVCPRDLAVLGRHARSLLGHTDDDDAYEKAVAGVDTVDVVALSDAVANAGSLVAEGLSAEAAQRCAAIHAMIVQLRKQVGSSVPDLVWAVLSETGLDIELAASPEVVHAQRAEGIDALMQLASEFIDINGNASLPAFLAWVEDSQTFDGPPKSALTPDPLGVSVLTAHTAKGLEWPVVAVLGLSRESFPDRNKNGVWQTRREQVPYPLWLAKTPTEARLGFPAGDPITATEFDAYKKICSGYQLLDERRLAYVALTRAQNLLIATGHHFGRDAVKPKGPGVFLVDSHRLVAAHPEFGSVANYTADALNEQNPLPALRGVPVAWPSTGNVALASRRRGAATEVRRLLANLDVTDGPDAHDNSDAQAERGAKVAEPNGSIGTHRDGQDSFGQEELSTIAAWDRDLELLAREALEAREERVIWIRLPAVMSSSDLMALARDEREYVENLARPMPRRPSSKARRGVRFHEVIERYFRGEVSEPLLAVDELPGFADEILIPNDDIGELLENLKSSGYADRKPYRVEEPFTLNVGGRMLRGRIDAVFDVLGPVDGGPLWEVVDWKTGRAGKADALQLSIYRAAWAAREGVPLEQVSATFVYVSDGTVRRYDHDELLDLERLGVLLNGAQDSGD